MLEDLFRACVLNFDGFWEDNLHLMELSYNNSYQSSIEMTHFEALHKRLCKSLVNWCELEDRLVSNLARETSKKVELIRKRIEDAQSRQKSNVDRRLKNLDFDLGDQVLVKVSFCKGGLKESRG